jgi:hypothetical protein
MGDEYLQSRLRHCKYDGANGARPKKLLMHMLKMAGSLEKGTVEECEAAYNMFVKDLALYEFSMGKIQVIADTNMREMDAYKELQDKLAGDMKRLSGEIETLKERVAHERVVRKNKEEYAALAKQVNNTCRSFFLSLIRDPCPSLHNRVHIHRTVYFLPTTYAFMSSHFAMSISRENPILCSSHSRAHKQKTTIVWCIKNRLNKYDFFSNCAAASLFLSTRSKTHRRLISFLRGRRHKRIRKHLIHRWQRLRMQTAAITRCAFISCACFFVSYMLD